MEIDLEPIRRAFQAEVDEDMGVVEQSLLALEKAPSDHELIASIFRKFHSLKGNAAGLGLERVSEFAHGIEDLLDRFRRGEEPVTPGHVGLLLRVVDAVRAIVPALGEGRDALPPGAEVLLKEAALPRSAAGATPPAPAASKPAGSEPVRVEPPPRPSANAAEMPVEVARTLRVEVARVDALLGVTSEIAIARGRLETLVQKHGDDELTAAYRSLERLLGQLHYSVSRVRMVPIAPLLRHYARVVRDLAVAHGKQAELVIEDQGVEVDNSVIEQLRAPLTHMVRNAVDHGLEPPAARTAAGKPATGRVALRARHEGSDIVIEIEDDGAGLDRERVLERARALGLAPEKPAAREIDRLIFLQGLSTARELSGTSGRGVGMDVVLRHVDSLGGSVDVDTDPGRRTTFTVRMPLTLAIVEGLVAEVAEAPLVVPMAGLVRCLDWTTNEHAAAGEGVANIEGQAVPFVRLRSAFEAGATPPSREVLVVVQKGRDRIGLAVDRLVGRAQVVVKAPGRFFSGLPAVAGLTILGDGRVAPVLNVAGLVHEHQLRTTANTAGQPGSTGAA